MLGRANAVDIGSDFPSAQGLKIDRDAHHRFLLINDL
jgi:hypothetical protein